MPQAAGLLLPPRRSLRLRLRPKNKRGFVLRNPSPQSRSACAVQRTRRALAPGRPGCPCAGRPDAQAPGCPGAPGLPGDRGARPPTIEGRRGLQDCRGRRPRGPRQPKTAQRARQKTTTIATQGPKTTGDSSKTAPRGPKRPRVESQRAPRKPPPAPRPPPSLFRAPTALPSEVDGMRARVLFGSHKVRFGPPRDPEDSLNLFRRPH